MISRPYRLCLVLLVAAGVLLAGCQNREENAPKAAASSPSGSHGVAMARGKIEVQGGLVDIAPPVDGIVKKTYVVEGQSVKAGQRLFALSDEASQAQVKVAEAELSLAEARQALREKRLPSLREAASRLDEAVRQGAVQAQRADDAHQALDDAQAELSVAKAAVSVARSQLDQARVALVRHEVTAPVGGVVVRLGIQEGGRAAADGTALVLLPGRPLIVRTELNEAYVSSVHVGMRAGVAGEVEDAGTLPSARVIRISPLVSSARLQDDSQRGPARVVECLLAFDAPPHQALVGQNVLVSFYK